MPTVMNRDEVAAFAHCPKPLCDGYEQVPVKGVREELGWTYAESGGDAPFVEKSSVSLVFADESEIPCPECGRAREISQQVRPEYANESQQPPDKLLEIKYAKKLERLEAENAELTAAAKVKAGAKAS